MAIIFTTGVFVIGALCLLLGLMKGKADDSFRRMERKRTSYEGLQRRLRRSGLLQTTPGFFVVVVGVLMGISYIIATLILGSFYPGLAVFIVVPVGAWSYLTVRERSYLKRASSELVPFLRKIEAQVRAGLLPQSAFAQAVSEANLLRPPLEHALIELRLNRPFVEVLRESTERLPLRSWEQFVRQLEIHAETGGDLASIITDAVKQINQLIQLQARMRAEFATFAKQQMVLIVVAIASFPGLWMMGLLGELTGSLTGWAVIGIAVLMMGLGVAYGQKSLRDIEEKLEF